MSKLSTERKVFIAVLGVSLAGAVGLLGLLFGLNRSPLTIESKDAGSTVVTKDTETPVVSQTDGAQEAAKTAPPAGASAAEKADYYRLQSQTRYAAGNYEEALADFKKAEALNPVDDHVVYMDAALIYYKLGQDEEAEKLLDKAETIAKTYVDKEAAQAALVDIQAVREGDIR